MPKEARFKANDSVIAPNGDTGIIIAKRPALVDGEFAYVVDTKDIHGQPVRNEFRESQLKAPEAVKPATGQDADASEEKTQ